MYVCMYMYINFACLLIQVGREKAEHGIISSYGQPRRSLLGGDGRHFGKDLARLANEETHKNDSSINRNKPEVPNTEQQQKVIAETYADDDKEVPYQEQHKSDEHQMQNVIEAAKLKTVENEHHV